MIGKYSVRWLAGICLWQTVWSVWVYAAASLLCGGLPWARGAFYAGSAVVALVILGSRGLPSLGISRYFRRPVCRRLGLVAVNGSLFLVLGEGSLRAYAALAGTSPFLENSLDAYRLVPGRDYGGGLRGNSLGYPGPDFQTQKRPGVFRIAALGDSFAVGPAVPFTDNFLTLLSARLPGTDVYNFGVSATGPREYLEILRRDVWRFHPDLVLVHVFVGNDVTESLDTPRHLDPRQHALYLLLTRAGKAVVSSPVPGPAEVEAAERAGPLSDAQFREVEARRLEVCRTPPPPALEKKWARALGYLDRLVADCGRHGVPAGIVLIPDEFQVNSEVLSRAVADAGLEPGQWAVDYPQARLTEFFVARGVPVLDLLPAFCQAGSTYAPRDTHWNVAGNRLAADKIAAFLAVSAYTKASGR